MGKEVQDQVSRIRTRPDGALATLERLLRVTPVDVLFHAVKDLLDVHPNVPGPDVIRLAPFQVLGHYTVHFFVIAAQNLRDVRVFGLDVEYWRALDVVEQFLTDRHPVLLRTVAALVAHRDERPRTKVRLAQHHHEIGQRLKTFALVSPNPNVQRRVLRQHAPSVRNPVPAPVHKFAEASLLESDQVVGRVMQRELCRVSLNQFLRVLRPRCVQATDAVFARRIFPNLARPQPAIPLQG